MSLSPARSSPADSGGVARLVAGDASPRHVAIIMDGNGRWAKARHLPRVAGHRAGVEAVRKVVEAAPDLGIEVLTLYAFSSENWKRPADEVGDLMGLLRHYIRSEINALVANGVRLVFIGDYKALKPDLVTMLEDARARTVQNTRMTLAIALNYGGQDEIVRVARALAAELSPEHIDAAAFEERLDTAGLPPPDVVVRTSGEQRLSNFLLWQAAYAEFVVTERLWPDFDGAALAEMVAEFATRERRFGGR